MRIISIVAVIFTATLLAPLSSVARDVSAKELAEFCSTHVRIADGSPHQATGAELFSSGMCMGYLKGYRDSVDGQDVFDVGGLVHCLPPEVSNGQLAERYAEWASSNTGQLQNPAAIGLARVMAYAFPCKQ